MNAFIYQKEHRTIVTTMTNPRPNYEAQLKRLRLKITACDDRIRYFQNMVNSKKREKTKLKHKLAELQKKLSREN